tara:strand:- start:2500 stop:3255 length:756 start_codon:yes stop_codon:yes gene_type:complete
MNTKTSSSNTSLIEKIDATAQLLTRVKNFRDNEQNAAYFRTVKTSVNEKISKYSDLFDFMIWIGKNDENNAKKVSHPAIYKEMLKYLESLKNELLKEPPLDTEKIDELREKFENSATQLIQIQETKASQSWGTFFDETLQLVPPNLYKPFAADSKYKKNCDELEKIHILLQEARNEKYLKDQNDRKEFLRNLDKYRNTIKKLPKIENEEIRDFLLAASSGQGVSLKKFTDSVKTFLEENSLFDQYRISTNE